MPKMELMIKKVYSKIFYGSNTRSNESIKSRINADNINNTRFHLIVNMNQTLPIASLYVFLSLNENNRYNENDCVIKGDLVLFVIEKITNLMMKLKRCIWGSLVIFAIKMNFID